MSSWLETVAVAVDIWKKVLKDVTFAVHDSAVVGVLGQLIISRTIHAE